jgi:hypothetical protein
MGTQLTELWYLALSYTVVNICAKLFNIHLLQIFGPGSVVGIATGYGLDDPGIESR